MRFADFCSLVVGNLLVFLVMSVIWIDLDIVSHNTVVNEQIEDLPGWLVFQSRVLKGC